MGVVGIEVDELASSFSGVVPWPDMFRSRGCRGVQRATLDPNKEDAGCSGVSGVTKPLLDSHSREKNKIKKPCDHYLANVIGQPIFSNKGV